MVCGFSLTLVSCLLRFFFYLTLFEYSIDPALGFINDYNKNKLWTFVAALALNVIVYWDVYISWQMVLFL